MMRCPSDIELARWSDGQTSGARAQEIRAHIEECLECRLATRDPAEDGGSPRGCDPDAGQDWDGAARASIPPFEWIVRRLRDAYASRGAADEGAGATAGAATPEQLRGRDWDFGAAPVLMAADSDGAAGVVTIPSWYGEDGRLVVTFRTGSSGGVTAFLVSEDADRVGLRVLRVGDRLFVSDLDGRAPITGMTADEVLSKEIAVLPQLASASFDLQDIPRGRELNVPLSLDPRSGLGAGVAVSAADTEGRRELRFELVGMTPGEVAVVASIDDGTTGHIFFSRGENEGRLTIDPALPPGSIRVRLVRVSEPN